MCSCDVPSSRTPQSKTIRSLHSQYTQKYSIASLPAQSIFHLVLQGCSPDFTQGLIEKQEKHPPCEGAFTLCDLPLIGFAGFFRVLFSRDASILIYRELCLGKDSDRILYRIRIVWLDDFVS